MGRGIGAKDYKVDQATITVPFGPTLEDAPEQPTVLEKKKVNDAEYYPWGATGKEQEAR